MQFSSDFADFNTPEDLTPPSTRLRAAMARQALNTPNLEGHALPATPGAMGERRVVSQTCPPSQTEDCPLPDNFFEINAMASVACLSRTENFAEVAETFRDRSTETATTHSGIGHELPIDECLEITNQKKHE